MIWFAAAVALGGPLEKAHEASELAKQVGDPDTNPPMTSEQVATFQAHWAVARKHAEKHVKRRGKTIQNQRILAEAAYGLQDRELFMASLTWLTENQPNDEFAWFMLAQLYEIADGDAQKGLDLFRRASEVAPGNPALQMGLADRLLAVAQDVDAAEAAYRTALAVLPSESPHRPYIEGRLTEIATFRSP